MCKPMCWSSTQMINDGLESRPVNICLAPENASKNRYNNVLACERCG